jgi:uncharacterized metal-binding protein YceD (DUF177 family)
MELCIIAAEQLMVQTTQSGGRQTKELRQCFIVRAVISKAQIPSMFTAKHIAEPCFPCHYAVACYLACQRTVDRCQHSITKISTENRVDPDHPIRPKHLVDFLRLI